MRGMEAQARPASSSSTWRPGVLCLVSAALAGGCATRYEPGATSVPAHAPPAESIAIELTPYFRDLRLTEVMVGDKRLEFLVDTAGGRTLISEELATAIGCTPSGRDVAYRMTGEPVIFQNCDSLVASASGFNVTLRPVAVFDVNALLPPELPKLDGVLALDAFRGQVVSIDWGNDRLIVHSAHDAERALSATGLPTRIATGENGSNVTALVPVPGLSRPLWFLLDSGDIRGTLVGRHVREQGLLSSGADGAVRIAIGARPAVSLTPIVDDINLDGVLGTEYLKLQIITLDLRRTP